MHFIFSFPSASTDSKKQVAACQTWGTNQGRSIGDDRYKTLRYVDGQLILTYRHGEACRSGVQRSTIINFQCNESAGVGYPFFNREDYCNYFFDWQTSYVCPRARKTGASCRIISKDNVVYDLTELVKIGNDNWKAVSGLISGHLPSNAQVYINVCGPLRNTSETRRCPPNTAACIITPIPRSVPSVKSLGTFTSPPTLENDKSIKLTYSGGTYCTLTTGNRRKRQAIITFICNPGQLSSAPTLISKSADDCNYEFEWQTGNAIVFLATLSSEISAQSFLVHPSKIQKA